MIDLLKLLLGILASLFRSRADRSGESGSAATDQRASPANTKATRSEQCRSLPVCLALSLVSVRPGRGRDRQARNTHSLAPCWVSGVLALAIAQPLEDRRSRPSCARSLARRAAPTPYGAHQAFMVNYSSLASMSLSRRLLGICAAAGGHRLRAGGRFSAPIPTALQRSTFLSCQQSLSRFSIVSLSYGTPSALDIVWRNGKSDRGVDLSPDHRGIPVGPGTSIPHPGPGRLVRASLRAASACHGHSGSTDRPPITVAKCMSRGSSARSVGNASTI